MADATSSPPYEISIGGDIESSHFLSFVVERDMYQPDMAAIVLANQEGKYSTKKVGDPVEIKVGDDKTSIYKGEVVGLEPTYKGGEKTRILIRAMNKMHRLLRHRRSKTFQDMSDQQILSKVVSASGLSLQWKHDKTIQYKHVYQHNQTDMEFLRMRAGRMGCHIWCVDTKIFVQQPELSSSPIARLVMTEPGGTKGQGTIKTFHVRLNSSAILKKVTVQGWNPETKDLISADFSAQSSRLGSQNAVAASGELGSEETFTVDHPIWDKEEAAALAKARLEDLSLSFITGECEITGDPRMDLGKVVDIEANSEPDTKADDPFNGRYYIMGVTHRYVLSKTKDGGYSTILRLARDAQKA